MPANIRVARIEDASAIAAIYLPIVRDTVISFELEAPSVRDMSERIGTTLTDLPWLVSTDAKGQVDGYVYASRHRQRAAYQWAVDTTVYVRCDRRRQGLAAKLYRCLLQQLEALNYRQAFAGIALPNEASVALHESVGFRALGVYRQVGYKLGAWHDVGWWQAPIGVASGAPAAPIAFDGRLRSPATPLS